LLHVSIWPLSQMCHMGSSRKNHRFASASSAAKFQGMSLCPLIRLFIFENLWTLIIVAKCEWHWKILLH
jgi:hypothetical protein